MAPRNGWHITSSKEPTYTTIRGNSNPAIFMAKGVQMKGVTYVEREWERITDHLPITSRGMISNVPPERNPRDYAKYTKK